MKKLRNAFSIVELLIVMSVIAVLLSETLLQEKNTLESAQYTSSSVIEKVAKENFYKYQAELINKGSIESQTFKDRTFNVHVEEDQDCFDSVKVVVYNDQVKTEMSFCTIKNIGATLKNESV